MITKEVYEEQKALSDRWKEMYYEKKNETNQLTNDWNELEEYLNHEIEEWQDVSDDWTKAQVQEDKIILNKMKEIKERDNESN